MLFDVKLAAGSKIKYFRSHQSQRELKKFAFGVAAVSGRQKSMLFHAPQSEGNKKVYFLRC
jgi:hypothetical protein